MRFVSRPKKSRALHVRFRRVYQFAFVGSLIMGGGIWLTVQQGLDDVGSANISQTLASTVRADIDAVASALGRVEDSPDSPVLHSDLQRFSVTLRRDWGELSSDIRSMPPEVRVLFAGQRGLDAQVTNFVSSTMAVASVARDGGLASGRPVDVESRMLEGNARDLSERFGQVITSYDARVDSSVTSIRNVSHLSFISAVAFLLALIVGLLRPLEKQLKLEHEALIDAGDSHRAEAIRQELVAHLVEGLDAAETEPEAMMVVSRAFVRVAGEHPVELLLADSSRSKIRPAASNPNASAPGCGVDSPAECPAITRGRTMCYEDSEAINACPMLAGRSDGRCSAVCIPLSFMGQSMGVIHSIGGVDTAVDTVVGDELSMIATQVAVRVGTIRSFAKIELQASTDLLTGLPNRRATEDRVERLVMANELGSVAMADLDHFKMLNDTYGHEAGDRALRLFSDAVSESLREQDWVGRWGGEEFVFVLPGLLGDQAIEALDRVRNHLAEVCMRAEAPTVKVSMGVVDTRSADTTGNLLRLADEALLAAKTQGRDRVVLGPIVSDLEEPLLEGTESVR